MKFSLCSNRILFYVNRLNNLEVFISLYQILNRIENHANFDLQIKVENHNFTHFRIINLFCPIKNINFMRYRKIMLWVDFNLLLECIYFSDFIIVVDKV